METEIEKKIRVRLSELPEDVQNAINAADLGEKIRRIGVKHSLHIDQLEALDIETRLVMLGFTDPDAFSTELTTNVKVAAAEAESIAQDISTGIFLPIRESMRQYMEEKQLQNQVYGAAAEKDETSSKPSVIMPSAANVSPKPSMPVPDWTPPVPAPIPPPVVPPIPPKPAESHDPDLMLIQPTISLPSAPTLISPAPASTPSSTPAAAPMVEPPRQSAPEAPKPPQYKVDPYREPPE